jgi:uncharacterized protein YecT (DUF1311 family)
MKRLLLLCALGALAASFPPAVRAQSQGEMNAQASADFAAADKALNAVYKKLTAALDARARKNLQASQRAWVVFRDAEAEFSTDLTDRGGSIFPMDYEIKRTELTKERTKTLAAYLADQGK